VCVVWEGVVEVNKGHLEISDVLAVGRSLLLEDYSSLVGLSSPCSRPPRRVLVASAASAACYCRVGARWAWVYSLVWGWGRQERHTPMNAHGGSASERVLVWENSTNAAMSVVAVRVRGHVVCPKH
jgi:hypothetical protein